MFLFSISSRKPLASIGNMSGMEHSGASFSVHRKPKEPWDSKCANCRPRHDSLSSTASDESSDFTEGESGPAEGESGPTVNSSDADIDCVVSALLELQSSDKKEVGIQVALDEILTPKTSKTGSDQASDCASMHSLISVEHNYAGNSGPLVRKGGVVDAGAQTSSVERCCVSTQVGGTGILGMIKNDVQMRAFTGTTFAVLDVLVEAYDLVMRENPKCPLLSVGRVSPTRERIVLTLCKLKLGLSFVCLGAMSGVCERTACNYFISTIAVLACALKQAVYWPSKEEILANIPQCFKKFKNTRVVLDCTEIQVQKPKCLSCRTHLYSSYKGAHTVKVCIGVTPCGLISWVSDVYGGRASDKAIVEQSNILDRLLPREDAVMVDKGFHIGAACEAKEVEMIRPPFASSTEQMPPDDVARTRCIASARVHVERAIQRMKVFVILEKRLPLTLVPYVDYIMIVIAGLVNLSPPILSDKRFSESQASTSR